MPASPRPPSLLAHPSYLAGQLVKVAQRHLNAVFLPYELLPTHMAVLLALADLGAQSQQDLADRLDLDKSHMVGFVDHLDGRGLVLRERDPGDRRRNLVGLTDDGRRLVPELRKLAGEAQDHIFAALDPGERAALCTLLERALEVHDAERLGVLA